MVTLIASVCRSVIASRYGDRDDVVGRCCDAFIVAAPEVLDFPLKRLRERGDARNRRKLN